MSWPADLQNLLTDYYQKKAALTNWSGVQAMESLVDSHEESMKNREAESAAVRKKLWGSDESGSAASEDMRQTILGDVTHPAPVIMQQPQQSSMLPTAALAAAAGLGGYLFATKDDPTIAPPTPTPIVQQADTETINVGLGKIDDYLPQGSK